MDGQIFCPHCANTLSKKAYETHKRLFYDDVRDQWIKKARLTTQDHQNELALTECAVEECDYEFGGDRDVEGSFQQNDSCLRSSDSPPPLVDFEAENDNSIEEPAGDVIEPHSMMMMHADEGRCTIMCIWYDDYDGACWCLTYRFSPRPE